MSQPCLSDFQINGEVNFNSYNTQETKFMNRTLSYNQSMAPKNTITRERKTRHTVNERHSSENGTYHTRANYSRGNQRQTPLIRISSENNKVIPNQAHVRKVNLTIILSWNLIINLVGFIKEYFLSQVVPMLGMVVTVFILCWSPILIFEVLQSYNIIGTQIFGSIKHTKTCFSLLAYFNRYICRA